MSQLWIDGFDGYAQTSDLNFRYANQSTNLYTTSGRWGGGAIEIGSAGDISGYINAPLVTEPSEIWEGFSFNNQSTVGNNTDLMLATWVSPNGVECCLTYNTLTLVFKLYSGQGNSETVLGTSSPILLAQNVWHYIDLHFKLATTGGLCEVWVDNTRVMNATGLNTSSLGGTEIVVMTLGAGHAAFSTINAYIDDWCARDPNSGATNITRIGDSRVCTTVPNSDAGPNNGTPSTSGPHYAMVDEAQWSSANTVTLTNTTGQAEQYGMSSLPVTPVNIYAVQVVTFAEKTDGGTASAKQYVDSGGTIAYGPPQNPLDPYGVLTSIFEVDPHVSAAWTEASVNAAQTGYQVQ